MKINLALAALVGSILLAVSCTETGGSTSTSGSGGATSSTTASATVGSGGAPGGGGSVAACGSVTGAGGATSSATSSTSSGGTPGPIPYLLPIAPVVVDAEDPECGYCSDIIGTDPSIPACNQATADLVDALAACSCAMPSACAAACSAYVEPNMSITLNWCDGEEPNVWCKVCLVTSSSATPPGCYDAFYACVDDVAPTPPFVCSESFPGALSCGEGYTGYPACDYITVFDHCIDDGNLICPIGYDWVDCCTTDDAATGGLCVPSSPAPLPPHAHKRNRRLRKQH